MGSSDGLLIGLQLTHTGLVKIVSLRKGESACFTCLHLAKGWLIESFVGVGPDESKAIEDEFAKFMRSSIHVLLATLATAADSTVLCDLLHGEETRIWGIRPIADKPT